MKILLREMAKAKKGWSLYRLAKEMGVYQQTIYAWHQGRNFPTTNNLDRLCWILDCTIDELLIPEPPEGEVA